MPDDLDRKIIHGLNCSPRVSFRRLSEIVGVSEQTVARRYSALRRGGVVRVIGLSSPAAHGRTEWIARLRCRPDAVGPLADSLARRPEVAYASIASGGSEIICIVRSPAGTTRDDVLLRQLPRAASVLDLNVDLLVHAFGSPDTAGWTGREGSLTNEQVRMLTSERPTPAGPPLPATDEDLPLLEALAEDGRASHTRLAEVTGWSKPRVAQPAGGPGGQRLAGLRHRRRTRTPRLRAQRHPLAPGRPAPAPGDRRGAQRARRVRLRRGHQRQAQHHGDRHLQGHPGLLPLPQRPLRPYRGHQGLRDQCAGAAGSSRRPRSSTTAA